MTGRQVGEIPIHLIEEPEAPLRITPNDEGIVELAKSIALHGLLQPVLVAPLPQGRYRLIAGHRRLLAHRLLGRKTILVRVMDVQGAHQDILALTENMHRSDMNPLEEAIAIKRLIEVAQLTQGEVAELLNKDRTWVAKRLALLDLDEDTMNAVLYGQITASQALELRRIDDPDLRAYYLRVCVEQGATVKQLRRWVEQIKHGTRNNSSGTAGGPKPLKRPKWPCAHCGGFFELKEVRTVWLCKKCAAKLGGKP